MGDFKLTTVEEFEAIGRWLAGSRAYYLQAFRENENLLAYYMASGAESISEGYCAFSKEEMEEMPSVCKRVIDGVKAWATIGPDRAMNTVNTKPQKQ